MNPKTASNPANLPPPNASKRDEPRSISPIPRPDFVSFNRYKAVRVYRRNLPHWRQEGVTYFITIRLADSIPTLIRKKWEEEKRIWLEVHGITFDKAGRWRPEFEKLPAKEQARFHRHFNRQVEACLDRGVGHCWLRKSSCIEIVRDRLLGNDGDLYHLGDFVIMPNHLHMLITPTPGIGVEEAEGNDRNRMQSYSRTIRLLLAGRQL